MNINVTHDKEYQQFTVELNGNEDAELAYSTPSPKVLDFTHTFVPSSARGKGVASKLIETALCYADENNYQIIVTCPVVAKYVEQHPEYKNLLKSAQ